MKDDLKIKEDEHSKQKNNNVEMLNKFQEEKDRLHTKVINLPNKLKEKEKKLKHMDDEASVHLEGSRKGKRSYSEFSHDLLYLLLELLCPQITIKWSIQNCFCHRFILQRFNLGFQILYLTITSQM